MKTIFASSTIALLLGVLASQATAAGIKYETEDGDYVKLGGRIQLQYHMMDPDGGESTDELKFRRLRPYIEGSVYEDYKGKIQFDFGKSSTEVKDAYFQYKGIEDMKVSIGNMNFPFSRELLTSSKKQQLVERTFVGDHNYGSADRQAGVHVSGTVMEDQVEYGVAVAKGAIDPDDKKLDFDTVISLNAGEDWQEGDMVGGRLEFFPLGKFKPEQGDFKGESKVAFAVGAFTWDYDGDTPAEVQEPEVLEDGTIKAVSKHLVDNVVGLEVSAAVRGGGFSVDAQYNQFSAELVDDGVTSGIYKDSETTLENYAVEGGFMVLPGELEIVGGFQAQDADNYAKTWTRTSIGVNYFMQKHDIKYQLTYRVGENKDGKDGKDVDEVFIQAQYVF